MNAPDSGRQHPAVELGQLVGRLKEIDEQRLNSLKERQDLEGRARELITEVQKLVESASFTIDGPTKEDADNEKRELDDTRYWNGGL